MASRVTRRRLLQFGVSASAAVWVHRLCLGDTGAARSRARQFSWDDAYHRADIETVSISASGEVAIQVTRSLAAGGVYGGFPRRHIQPRGEIWMVNGHLDRPICLALGSLWAWAPCFSPLGTRLAALVSPGDGRVGFVVWDVKTHRSEVFIDAHVDVYGTFSSDRAIEGRPSLEAEFPKQFAWLDEETIIFVDSGEQSPQFELDLTSATRTYASLRRRSADGAASVRVWGDTAAVCGAGRSIVRINTNSGERRCIYRGAVRGASVSPDRKWLAALIATKHIQVPNEAMAPGLRYITIADDPLVLLALVRIDLSGTRPPAEVNGFSAVGAVAPRRLPVWSDDSKRFAVPARSTYSSNVSSGDDTCWQVQADTLLARRWNANSALDAELLAALVVSVPREMVEATVERRPRQIGGLQPDAKFRVGQGPGAVWRYGKSRVAVWDRKALILIDESRSLTLEGEYSAVYAPGESEEGAYMFAIRRNGRACGVRLFGLEYEVADLEVESSWVYLGVHGADGTMIFKEDAESATSIIAAGNAGKKHTSPLVLNTHFRDIERPVVREVLHRTREGRDLKGILQLPSNRSLTERHPVVIWAYPDHTPSFDDSLTRINSTLAVWLPLQYLLTRGIAVFHAPLPTILRPVGAPIEFVTKELVPWLDVLDKRSDIVPGEYGFFGHSNGGYVALALEAVTTRFKAIVAYSTFPDLGITPLTGTPDKAALDCGGQTIQADRFYHEDLTQPYSFGKPFWMDEGNFIQNSPLYRMQRATTPLLLLQAEFDYGGRAIEAVFSILYGRGIPVELAYYWGEGHVVNSPANIHDLWDRTARFFCKHLSVRSR